MCRGTRMCRGTSINIAWRRQLWRPQESAHSEHYTAGAGVGVRQAATQALALRSPCPSLEVRLCLPVRLAHILSGNVGALEHGKADEARHLLQV
eukprot:363326-Chlamydomonas_euryale.AAC.8